MGLGSSSASYLSLLINSLILYALAYVIYIFVLYWLHFGCGGTKTKTKFDDLLV
jgi:miniconductance mechanosensitive channel